MSYQSNISNDEVAATPQGSFDGQILIVDNAESMLKAEKLLSGCSILGFDTETRPSFSKNVHHSLSLLQLSTQKAALLFRVKQFPLSDKIVRVLEDKDVLKIGAAIRDDIKSLNKVAPFEAAGFIDLQTIIYKWGIEEKSVRKMAAIVLGIRVSKAQRLSNWDATKLTTAQMEYAATDAWVCREIYLKLNSK